MEDKREVPFFVHEAELYRAERFNKRLSFLFVVQNILFIGYLLYTRL